MKKPEDELRNLLDVPLGRRPVLSPDVEKHLVEYCLEMDKIHFGLTTKDLKRMTFQIAIRNNLPHPFSGKTKSAGRKWLRLFFKRHPALSHWQKEKHWKSNDTRKSFKFRKNIRHCCKIGTVFLCRSWWGTCILCVNWR